MSAPVRPTRALLCLSLALPACLHAGGDGDVVATTSEAAVVGPAAPDENDPRWHPAVRRIVATYHAWQPLDSPLRWAPQLCWIPTLRARDSAAGPATPHGRKLYQLFVQDPEAYGARPTAALWTDETVDDAPEALAFEQVIVKHAYVPEAIDADAAAATTVSALGPVERDGQWYAPRGDAGLFVMFRPREPVAPTDDGWVYAGVQPDGTITGAGRMASCMACHGRHEDRLFGLPPGDPAALTAR